MNSVRFEDDDDHSDTEHLSSKNDHRIEEHIKPTPLRKRSLSYRMHLHQTVKAFYVDEFNHLTGNPTRIIVVLAILQIVSPDFFSLFMSSPLLLSSCES